MTEEVSFRNYVSGEFQKRVQENIRLNHKNQTLQYVLNCKEKYSKLNVMKMNIWDALDLLNEVKDDSDPDTNLPQIYHALQTAEKIRKAYPDIDWFPLVGLIHDLGKILSHEKFGSNPQWAVVGDTYPVGCKFSDKIVMPQFFNENEDAKNEVYNTKYGKYSPKCGLRNLHLSWGHDEYMYLVCKGNNCKMPEEAMYIIRFHSFYAHHMHEGYDHFMDDFDFQMRDWLRKFQKFDLYSKHEQPPNVEETISYYKSLVEKYFPDPVLKW